MEEGEWWRAGVRGGAAGSRWLCGEELLPSSPLVQVAGHLAQCVRFVQFCADFSQNCQCDPSPGCLDSSPDSSDNLIWSIQRQDP